MLGLSIGPCGPGGPVARAAQAVSPPPGLGWDMARAPLAARPVAGRIRSGLDPRALVDPAIWTGPAFHVDGASGDDANSGRGAASGDFSDPLRTIHAAFTAGNATGAPYRVIVRPGRYQEAAFTKNGSREPAQPVAVIGWGGPVSYRTGPWVSDWRAGPGTWTTSLSAVRRVFRTDLLTADGLYTELAEVADADACAARVGSWCDGGGTIHVNVGGRPGPEDIALIRSFHGARFLSHADDLYLENLHVEGGITGALHCDADAARNVVGRNCSFRYSAPSSSGAPQDAVRIRRVQGLVAFFDSDASGGAKDGWAFHDDGVAGMHVLLDGCTGFGNGAGQATSCNAFTTHDAVRAAVLGSDFGRSRSGTEVHCIQNTRSWFAGCSATARDIDGTSVAYKCSNASRMWLEASRADASGPGDALAVQANGGQVFTRGLEIVSGEVAVSSGGAVTPF